MHRTIFEPCFLKLLIDLTFFRLYCFTCGAYVVARSVLPSSMLDLLVALFVLLNWQQFNVPYRYKKEGQIWAKWCTALRDRRLYCSFVIAKKLRLVYVISQKLSCIWNWVVKSILCQTEAYVFAICECEEAIYLNFLICLPGAYVFYEQVTAVWMGLCEMHRNCISWKWRQWRVQCVFRYISCKLSLPYYLSFQI